MAGARETQTQISRALRESLEIPKRVADQFAKELRQRTDNFTKAPETSPQPLLPIFSITEQKTHPTVEGTIPRQQPSQFVGNPTVVTLNWDGDPAFGLIPFLTGPELL